MGGVDSAQKLDNKGIAVSGPGVENYGEIPRTLERREYEGRRAGI
jgi:hypothetical protein